MLLGLNRTRPQSYSAPIVLGPNRTRPQSYSAPIVLGPNLTRPGSAATVVAVSEGYPGSYPKGKAIDGCADAAQPGKVQVTLGGGYAGGNVSANARCDGIVTRLLIVCQSPELAMCDTSKAATTRAGVRCNAIAGINKTIARCSMPALQPRMAR